MDAIRHCEAVILACALVACVPSAAAALDGDSERDAPPGVVVCWSQAPLMLDSWLGFMDASIKAEWSLFSEIASDFVPPASGDVARVKWWGCPTWDKLAAGEEAGPAPEPRRSSASLDCSDAVFIGNGWGLDSTTIGGAANVASYACTEHEMTGPEVVFNLFVPFAPVTLNVALSDFIGALEVFVLGLCDEDDSVGCGEGSYSGPITEAGWYSLAVDGWLGAASDFHIDVDCPEEPEHYFCIRFYEDDVRQGSPGALLYEYCTTDYHEEHVSGKTYSYWSEIPAFPVVSGERYWISIQGVVDINWGWSASDPVVLEAPFRDRDYGGVVGQDRWESLEESSFPHDVAFELSLDDTAVERTSWGRVKGMYR